MVGTLFWRRFGLCTAAFVLVAPQISCSDAFEDAILKDDECTSTADGSCGLSAAQLRGQMLVQQPTGNFRLEQDAAELLERAEKMEAEASAHVARLRQEAVALFFQAGAEEKARAAAKTLAAMELSGPSDAEVVPPVTASGKKAAKQAEEKKVKSSYLGGLVDTLKGEDQVAIMAARSTDWHIGGIVYQVYVDRFVPPKDLESKRQFIQPPRTLHNWTELPLGGVQNAETRYYTSELAFWGGDLQGVTSKLDYVHEFADILYLQPICDAYSVHKYDATDYTAISPEYGTIDDFKDLAGEVHKRGMHLVLDGVFNHIGVNSKWFKEAFADKDSKYRNWFFIGPEYDLGFKAWQGGGTLAELRLEDKSLQEALWNSSTSVVATWLQRGADGWRLDVGTEIGREFLWDLTQAAHRHKYASLVVGEVSAYPRWWTEALDGILSFWMGWIIKGVVHGEMGGVFAGMQLAQLISQTSMEQVLRSWIVLSNHDTPRLASVFPDVRLRQFAMALQFTLPGSVCIYYGEELGMTGAADPHNRAPMQWDQVGNPKNEMYNFTAKLVKIRRAHRALRIGDFFQLMSFSLLAFIRRTDRIDEITIILANPTDSTVEERVSIPVEDILEYTMFRDELSNATVHFEAATIQMPVPPHTMRILTMVHEIGPQANQYKRIYGHWNSFSSVEPSFSLGNAVSNLIRDPHVQAAVPNPYADDSKAANPYKDNPYRNPYINPYARKLNTTLDASMATVKPLTA